MDSKVLPNRPQVYAEGEDILVVESDGTIVFWKSDHSPLSASKMAKELELELKCMEYVKLKLADSLEEISNDIVDFGIAPELVPRLLTEGYFHLRHLLTILSDSYRLPEISPDS